MNANATREPAGSPRAIGARALDRLIEALFGRRDSAADRSLARQLMIAAITIAMLVGVVGGWAATTEIVGAVIAPGQLVVETNVKKVQHPTGGIVGELFVRDGQRVKAGDVVMRLDDTQTRANLSIVIKALDELAAREARFEAERDEAGTIRFPDTLTSRDGDADVARLIGGEIRLFESRRALRDGQTAQLHQQIEQLKEQISGQIAQATAKDTEISWNQKELQGIRELWEKKLIQFNRVTASERDGARLFGERGLLTAQIAEARGRIAETEIKILQINQEMRKEVGRELTDIRAKRSELVEKRVAAEDSLKRIELRAPIDGTVYQLAVHTVGGVVSSGEPVMLIVPTADALIVEVKISPQEIDQVRMGQKTLVRFSSTNQRSTPELNGTISVVSPDVTIDQKTAVSYYVGRIALSDAELTRLGEFQPIPGMPVVAFIQTAPRTVLAYLVRPIADQIYRAFRER